MITKIVQTQEEPGCQTIWAPFAQGVIHCRGLAGVFRVRTYRFCQKKRGLRYVFTLEWHSAGGLRGFFGSERIVFAQKNGGYDTFSLRVGTLPGACGGFSGQNVSFLLEKTGFTIRFHFGAARCRGLAGAFRVRTYRFCSKKRGLRYFLTFPATFLPALGTLHGVGSLSNTNSTNAGGVRLPDHMGSFCDVCGSPSLAGDRSGRLTRLVQGLPPDRSA